MLINMLTLELSKKKKLHALTCNSTFRNLFQGNNYSQVQRYMYKSISCSITMAVKLIDNLSVYY